jgi:hypothetical protein
MHPSVALLERRCLESPELVRTLYIEALEPLAIKLRHAASILCTGIGASEGPARLLASCLASQGRLARFIPLSALMTGDHRQWTAGRHPSLLVVFSQALSPNAKMALELAGDFSETILVCGIDTPFDERLQSLSVLRHPPERESGFLLRVTGPAVASAVALALVTLATTEASCAEIREQLRQVADAMDMRLRAGPGSLDLIEHPPAFLVYGMDGAERSHLLRWTLLECLDMHDPPIWDLLSFAHGPFQSTYDASHTLIVPWSKADVAIERLLGRLADMLGQTKHKLIDVPSELPRPWCTLEHLAMIHALVLDHLRRHGRDLGSWPGKGCDGPLYTLKTMAHIDS